MIITVGPCVFQLSFENNKPSEQDFLAYLTKESCSSNGSSVPDLYISFSERIPVPQNIQGRFSVCRDLKFHATGVVLVILHAKFILFCDWKSKKVNVRHTGKTSEFDKHAIQAIKYIFFYAVLRGGGLPLHSSALSYNSTGSLFLGKKGAGKTTVASLLSSRMLFYNDELNAVFPHNSQWYLYSTPFRSTNTIMTPSKANAPINRLFYLQKSFHFKLEEVTFKESFQVLMQSIYAPPLSDFYSLRMMDTTEKICRSYPVYKLYFNKDEPLFKKLTPYLQ